MDRSGWIVLRIDDERSAQVSVLGIQSYDFAYAIIKIDSETNKSVIQKLIELPEIIDAKQLIILKQ